MTISSYEINNNYKEINNNYRESKLLSYHQSLECRQGRRLLRRMKRCKNKYASTHFTRNKLRVER